MLRFWVTSSMAPVVTEVTSTQTETESNEKGLDSVGISILFDFFSPSTANQTSQPWTRIPYSKQTNKICFNLMIKDTKPYGWPSEHSLIRYYDVTTLSIAPEQIE